ncbi:DivIVA domain-containing protein [Micromonospora yangpuensis]|uniref:DivIVA domain-containing protein n=1 Tax=Micromonospora yangpuensis TaxID=683228 RepID=A0A1C6V358_9ACTN|nr:DivIVA domain-containing protein [Micromonospora yangpuensis]SCL60544.1 DivIVA domain-containing protein [Micromonospora yangpuensis]
MVRPTCYRSAAYRPLVPGRVRAQRFGWTPVGRRGLDPVEVYEFLERVAGDLAIAYEAVANSRREADRFRDALRRWQSQQARMLNERSYQS